jgi:alkanesulfonate monooxygenase SsuD/methylene tetrahydromethanopterin reductase-like flavin-dependent oxidoreductase (luciferase family)
LLNSARRAIHGSPATRPAERRSASGRFIGLDFNRCNILNLCKITDLFCERESDPDRLPAAPDQLGGRDRPGPAAEGDGRSGVRVGLSWDLDRDRNAAEAWSPVLGEIAQADELGYDSIWVSEGRAGSASCSSATLFMTYAARRTKSVQLRSAARHVTRANPVRIAEEVAVLDSFSRGRAGIAFAAAGRQGVPAGHVHETIEFLASAWASDEFRYRGEFVRFPAHTDDEAPRGASEPEGGGEYVPQWERGPIMPDFLAITPKPYATRPPVYVEIDDDETLEWAARQGVSPVVGAEVPTERAIARLERYRKTADAAGRGRGEVDAVLERRIAVDGESDAHALGGGSQELVCAIRDIRASTYFSHLVWRRSGNGDGDLLRFASEIQPLLQA